MAVDIRTLDDDKTLAHYPNNDEMLMGQLEMLPNPDEVFTAINQLELDDLREFAIAIMNVAVDSARKGHADLDTVTLINDWFATAEQLIAAGDSVGEILSHAVIDEARLVHVYDANTRGDMYR